MRPAGENAFFEVPPSDPVVTFCEGAKAALQLAAVVEHELDLDRTSEARSMPSEVALVQDTFAELRESVCRRIEGFDGVTGLETVEVVVVVGRAFAGKKGSSLAHVKVMTGGDAAGSSTRSTYELKP